MSIATTVRLVGRHANAAMIGMTISEATTTPLGKGLKNRNRGVLLLSVLTKPA
jgi:hypothetical protein